MIGIIQSCFDLLAHRANAEEIAAHIGSVKHDPGIPMSIEIEPRSSKLQSAELARDPESGQPYLLTLVPVPSERRALSSLEALFGPCKRTRPGLGLPASCIIDPAQSYDDCSIALILKYPVAPPGDEVLVHSVTLRRDAGDEEPLATVASKTESP
jgi:hypothetical protein